MNARKILGLSPVQLESISRNGRQNSALRTLTWFASNGPATVYECELDLGQKLASPYVKGLVDAGCLALTGERRTTRGTSTALVYAHVKDSSFVSYLSLPPKKKINTTVTLTPRDRTILEAARTYSDRIKALRSHSPGRAVRVALNFLRKLESLAP